MAPRKPYFPLFPSRGLQCFCRWRWEPCTPLDSNGVQMELYGLLGKPCLGHPCSGSAIWCMRLWDKFGPRAQALKDLLARLYSATPTLLALWSRPWQRKLCDWLQVLDSKNPEPSLPSGEGYAWSCSRRFMNLCLSEQQAQTVAYTATHSARSETSGAMEAAGQEDQEALRKPVVRRAGAGGPALNLGALVARRQSKSGVRGREIFCANVIIR